MRRVVRRGLRITWAVLRRLRFFPFTLIVALLQAAIRVRELRRGYAVARVVQPAADAVSLALSSMLWLDDLLAARPARPVDVCLRLPSAAIDNLHDVFSVFLAAPRLRSIGLYWDDTALADDWPLWTSDARSSLSTSGEEILKTPDPQRLERAVHSQHARPNVPVSAQREVQALLKRQAGHACVVVLNLPQSRPARGASIRSMAPGVRFFEVTALPGFTLHERIALVQAADGYVGIFDELGFAAISSGRPALFVAGAAGSDAEVMEFLGGLTAATPGST